MHMRRTQLTRLTAALLVIGVAGVLGLGLAEILLRVAVPANSEYHVLRPREQVVFHPRADIFSGVAGAARYVVNSAGIRGDELTTGSDQYRILAVGGSTTQLLYLDGSEAWPYLVQQDLKATTDGAAIWVGNVGKSGANARDHVVHVKYLVPQIPELDAILLLVGVNDLTVALSQGAHYRVPVPITDSAAERAQIRTAFAVAPGKLHQPATEAYLSEGAPWFKRLALYQLMKRGRMIYSSWQASRGLAQDDKGEVLETWRKHRRTATVFIDSLPRLDEPLREYRTNLDAIVELASRYKIRLVMMTQPVIWRENLSADELRHLWLGGTGRFQVDSGQSYYTPRVLADAMRQYNEVLLDVCAARGIECLDLAARIPRDTLMFYDDVHFTERGSRTVAAEIAAFLRERPPLTIARRSLSVQSAGAPTR
jgi:lysophospholipase L1-like esterase